DRPRDASRLAGSVPGAARAPRSKLPADRESSSRRKDLRIDSMSKRRVLYVVHNHPRLRPGGAEAYALELYEAMRERSSEFEPIFLAAARPPVEGVPPRRDTVFAPVNGDFRQYYFINDPVNVDWFFCTAKNKNVATKSFRDFLLATKPDVVHFQH